MLSAPLNDRDLNRVEGDMETALLAYLNLPPVGCIADKVYVPGWGEDDPYEIPSVPRTALLKRRDQLGRFSSLGDLIGVEGFGADDLGKILVELEDLNRYGNRARPVWGGPEANQTFFDLIESATRYIHISTYILHILDDLPNQCNRKRKCSIANQQIHVFSI